MWRNVAVLSGSVKQGGKGHARARVPWLGRGDGAWRPERLLRLG